MTYLGGDSYHQLLEKGFILIIAVCGNTIDHLLESVQEDLNAS